MGRERELRVEHHCMENTPWLRVPVGSGASAWTTIANERTVLVVVRTATTVGWLLELLPELLGDYRVQVVFTMADEGSAFETGVAQVVGLVGARLIPWRQAIVTEFDVAISASHLGGLDQLLAPLLIVPHGPGYTKAAGLTRADQIPVSRAQRRDFFTTVALTHENQQGFLSPYGDAIRVAITGDPCMDNLQTSRSHRSSYRSALGVSAGRRLVVVSSTWGHRSLIGTHPAILDTLLAALPADEYVVAAILHPNIWVGHSIWQVRTWVRRALEGGLRLVPYVHGWRGSVVAADCLIGDHGSVTFYAAALGTPVILGTFGADEMVPGSPQIELGQQAPALDWADSVRRQIEHVAADGCKPERYSHLSSAVFAHPGDSLDLLRGTLYALMRLDIPKGRARVLAAPDPRPEVLPILSYRVLITDAAASSIFAPPHIKVERFAACLSDDAPERPSDSFEHIQANLAEHDFRVRESAAVLILTALAERTGQAANTHDDPAESLRCVLSQHPGCSVAACQLSSRDALVAIRRGPLLLANTETSISDSVGFLASAVYHLWATYPRTFFEQDLITVTIAIGALEVIRVRVQAWEPA